MARMACSTTASLRRSAQFGQAFEKNGAGDEIRTHDFNLGKVRVEGISGRIEQS